MPGYVAARGVPDDADLTPETDPISAALAEQLRDHIWMGANASPRSLQQSIGASEIGGACERQIAYKALGVRPCNFPDPLRALAGTGMHLALGEVFERLDGGVGRFLIEAPVTYRGIPGHADLADRRRLTLVDYKTSTKAKIRQLRREGPPRKSVVQVQTYGVALRAQAEQIERVALAFIPLDGELADIWVWSAPVDAAVADEWVDRYERIAAHAHAEGPASLPANPTRLCGWCSHHRPGSTDLAIGCPGGETNQSS